MLEKPNLADEKIAACLCDAYGLKTTEIVFLPLGADINTVVYRVVNDDGLAYFVKLRRGDFDTIAVDVPKFLHDQGIKAIIAPMTNRSGQLSTTLGDFNLILYPFIEGQGGWDVDLSDAEWVVFGQALKAIHGLALPPALAARIPRETYSSQWREQVKQFQAPVEHTQFTDPVAAALATFLKDKQAVMSHLIKRADDLGAVLQQQPAHEVLCHSDIHVGNILMSNDARTACANSRVNF